MSRIRMPISCEECREHWDELLDAAEGVTAGGSATSPAAGEHLKSCADCRADLTLLRNARAALRTLPAQQAPDDLRARIRAAIAAEIASGASHSTPDSSSPTETKGAVSSASGQALSASGKASTASDASELRPIVDIAAARPAKRPFGETILNFFRRPSNVAWASGVALAVFCVSLVTRPNNRIVVAPYPVDNTAGQAPTATGEAAPTAPGAAATTPGTATAPGAAKSAVPPAPARPGAAAPPHAAAPPPTGSNPVPMLPPPPAPAVSDLPPAAEPPPVLRAPEPAPVPAPRTATVPPQQERHAALPSKNPAPTQRAATPQQAPKQVPEQAPMAASSKEKGEMRLVWQSPETPVTPGGAPAMAMAPADNTTGSDNSAPNSKATNDTAGSGSDETHPVIAPRSIFSHRLRGGRGGDDFALETPGPVSPTTPSAAPAPGAVGGATAGGPVGLAGPSGSDIHQKTPAPPAGGPDNVQPMSPSVQPFVGEGETGATASGTPGATSQHGLPAAPGPKGDWSAAGNADATRKAAPQFATPPGVDTTTAMERTGNPVDAARLPGSSNAHSATSVRTAQLVVKPSQKVPLARVQIKLPPEVRLVGSASPTPIVWEGAAEPGQKIEISLALEFSGQVSQPLEVRLQTRDGGKTFDMKSIQLNASPETATKPTAVKPTTLKPTAVKPAPGKQSETKPALKKASPKPAAKPTPLR